MSTYTDQEIVDSLKKRENHVVAFIAKRFMPMISYLIKEQKADFLEVDDLFQDALMIIIKKIDSGEFTLTAKFSTYLYAICKNLIDYHLKKKDVRNRFLTVHEKDNFHDEDFSEDYDENLQQKLYLHYFNKLGPTCQEVLRLYWLDVSIKEIADKLGNTDGFIRKKKHECKKRLIELVLTNPDNIKPD